MRTGILAVAVVGWLAGGVHAQPRVALQNLTGLAQAPGWTITDFVGTPVLSGGVVATVVLVNNPSVGTRPAVVAWSAGTGARVMLGPEAAVGGRVPTAIVTTSLRVDDAGRLLLVVRDAIGDRLVRLSGLTGAASAETLLESGAVLPGMPPGRAVSLLAGQSEVDGSLRVSGDSIALLARLSNVDVGRERAVIAGTASGLRVALYGEQPSGDQIVMTLDGPAIARNGRLMGTGTLGSAGNEAIWMGTSAGQTLAAQSGWVLPTSAGLGSLVDVNATSMAGGSVRMRGRTLTGGPDVSAVWSSPSSAPGLWTSVAELNGPLGSGTGALGTAAVVGTMLARGDGQTLMCVRLTGPGIGPTNDYVLALTGPAGTTVLAREGDAITGTGGALTLLDGVASGSVTLVQNSAGGAAWVASLFGAGVTTSNDRALLLARAGQGVRPVLRTGEAITGLSGSATVTSISWGSTPTSGDDGRPSGLSDTAAAVLADITVAGGFRKAVVLVPLGPGACGLGDIAGPGQAVGADGQLTADDIIVFLGWFFAADVRADIAGPGQSTVLDGAWTADDIIVFLGRFFAGC